MTAFWRDLDERPGLAPYPRFTGEQQCAGHETDVFFPDSGTSIGHRDAVEICAGCPFAAPCLAFAVDRAWVAGIWAGTTQKERQRLRALRGRRTA